MCRRDEADDAAGEGRLAAAGFADEPERLAAHQVEGDVRDRLHRADLPLEDQPFADREFDGEMADGQHRLGIGGGYFGHGLRLSQHG